MINKNDRNAFQRALSRATNAIFAPKSRTSKRSRPRSLKCERLEDRQLFAADAFVGVYNGGDWSLGDNPAQHISFGLPGDQPVMGDWNGDGRETPGIYRNGTWVLDMTGNGFDAGDRVLSFGLPGDKAVAGDWDGDGIDTVGVFRNGAWFFDRNGNGYDAADVDPVFFGWGSDTPVPGDWNGDGKDTPGIYRDGTWALDLTGNGFDAGDRFLQFGLPGDQPVSGDWNHDGKDTPAVLQNNRWFFDLEGNGYTGEVGTPNRFGAGIAVAGESSIGPRPIPLPAPHVVKPQLSPGPVPSPPTAAPIVKPVPSPPTAAPVGKPKVEIVSSSRFWHTSKYSGTTADFTVRNLGNATLTLGSVVVTGPFSVVHDLNRTLAPNASATFRIRLDRPPFNGSPFVDGPGRFEYRGAVSFTTNDPNRLIYDIPFAAVVTDGYTYLRRSVQASSSR